jgi:hypothetical protein
LQSETDAGIKSGVPHIEATPETTGRVLGRGSDQDIDAMLERGAVVLRASGRLLCEDEEADRSLVLAIVDAVMPVNFPG